MSRYLQNKKVFQKYRVVTEYDKNTNDFPRDDNGNIDKSFEDIYIPQSLVPSAVKNRMDEWG